MINMFFVVFFFFLTEMQFIIHNVSVCTIFPVVGQKYLC